MTSMAYNEIKDGYYWVHDGGQYRIVYVQDGDVTTIGSCKERSLSEVLNYIDFIAPVFIPIEFGGKVTS